MSYPGVFWSFSILGALTSGVNSADPLVVGKFEFLPLVSRFRKFKFAHWAGAGKTKRDSSHPQADALEEQTRRKNSGLLRSE